MADASPTGRARSFGVMANYLYEPDRIPERAEAYATRGEVPMSSEVASSSHGDANPAVDRVYRGTDHSSAVRRSTA